jgi:hypothetical protein
LLLLTGINDLLVMVHYSCMYLFVSSPYAQPREQTYLQRQDLVGSERILQEDLLSKGKDAHSSNAFMVKMGYQPRGSITSSLVPSLSVSATASVDSQDPE